MLVAFRNFRWVRRVAFVAILSFLFALAGPHILYAQDIDQGALNNLRDAGVSANIAQADPGVASPGLFIARFIAQILVYVGLVFMALIIFGGIMWMTSAGNEDRVTKSKQLLQNAIIGLGITVAGYLITRFVLYIVFKAASGPGFNPVY